MRVLKTTLADPLDGWFFYVEQTGAKINARTYESLMTLVEAHLRINEIDIPTNLGVLVQDQISKRIPVTLSNPYED